MSELDQRAAVLGASVVNHLWQSTLFAAAIWLLTLLFRKNSARLRYRLWLVASLKFLVPFLALSILGPFLLGEPDGSEIPAAPAALAFASDLTAPAVPRIEPMAGPDRLGGSGPALASPTVLVLVALALVWALGVAVVMVRWWLRWMQLRRTVRAAVAASDIDFPARVRSSSTQLEPVVAGILRPVLLLPAGIHNHLSPGQMRAVLAHERCHLRRRDNLTAALHMLVEALFWFYPPVWWIGARLIEERERDCDEQVLQEGHAPRSYAEGILRICEHYLASRLPCASGVSGSDLRKRVEQIVRNAPILQLGKPARLVFTAAATAAACVLLVVPVIASTVNWPAVRANSLLPSTRAKSLYLLGRVQYTAVIAAHNDDFSTKGSACTGRSVAVTEKQATLATTAAQLGAADGAHVLEYAVAANSLRDTQRLLAAKASRRADNFIEDRTLMHVAARDGDALMLQMLLDAGFDVEGRSPPRQISGWRYRKTPLQEAIAAGRYDNAAWFMTHGADINATGTNGMSALTFALMCRNPNLVEKLLRAGAKPGAREEKMARNLKIDLHDAPVQ